MLPENDLQHTNQTMILLIRKVLLQLYKNFDPIVQVEFLCLYAWG